MDLMSVAQLLGNVGEFVGAVAVVVTLVYLARQIRFSARAQTTAIQHEILTEFRKGQELLIENPDLLDAFVKLALNQVVPESSQVKLQIYIGNQFRIYEELYLAHLKGSVDDEFWWSRKTTLRDNFLARHFVQSWWQNWGAIGFSAPFIELVEELTDELQT